MSDMSEPQDLAVLRIRDDHPHPDPDFYPSRIPDPDPQHWDLGALIWILITDI
jgi:hypothetical protein